MFRVIHHCLQDTRTLIDHLASDSQADISRCGVTGLSMGGYASFTLFANLQQVRVAVPMIGLPHFTRRWLDILDESAFSNPDWASALEKIQPQVESHTRFIEEIDPYEKLKQAAPKPLFIMNCDFDAEQPKLYAVYACRELLPFYKSAPQNLRLRIYPAEHEVTPEMEDQAVDWFCQHLLRA
jgi:cephalosporin-C deacetylase-like acetyl esterase